MCPCVCVSVVRVLSVGTPVPMVRVPIIFGHVLTRDTSVAELFPV